MQREKLRPAELPAIPGFELVRRLGRGGMGEVFEAVRLGSGGFRKPVALKTLNPGIEPKSLERFLHECRITAQLEHPNIVRVYDLLTLAQRHFLVMELLRGRVLSVLQEAKGSTDWFALSVADQVLDGLAYAHDFTDEQGLPLGIVHRDLTPRNLFVCDSGTVKILDFGLARMKNAAALALTQEGMVAGTPAYLSPEQANGLSVDVRTDLYQLGATLYDLLTGRPPHGDGYLHEQLAHARSGQFTPLSELRPDLPPGLVSLVERALSTSPDARFPTARAMREAVQQELSQCSTRGPSALARSVAAVPSALPPPAPRKRLDGRATTSPEFRALGSESTLPTSPAEDALSASGAAAYLRNSPPAPAPEPESDIQSGEHPLPRPSHDSRVGFPSSPSRASRSGGTPFPRGPSAKSGSPNRPGRAQATPSALTSSPPSFPFETPLASDTSQAALGMEEELPTAPNNARIQYPLPDGSPSSDFPPQRGQQEDLPGDSAPQGDGSGEGEPLDEASQETSDDDSRNASDDASHWEGNASPDWASQDASDNPSPHTPHPDDALDESDSLELPRGARVAGRYRIERFLAQGGMGAVYEAKDLELQETVALKTIRPELAGDERTVERFKREIHLARRVTHPNVCRIFDIGFHSNQGGRVSSPGVDRIIFLTMELVQGETLAERLRRVGRLSTEEALPIATQVAMGLAAAHRAGVVHGDLKPDNVVLEPPRVGEPQGRAVITDFGLARATASGNTSVVAPTFAGSPAYMSPEQVEGQPVTSASDVYGLGIVLYEMVTGHRPFIGDTPMAVALGRVRAAPPSPRSWVPTLDSTWEATILRCLERDPARRYHAAEEVLYALGGDMSISSPRMGVSPASLSNPNLAAPPSPETNAAKRASPRLWGLTLLLAGVLGGGLFWRMNELRAAFSHGTSSGQPAVKLRRAVAVLGFHNLSGRPDAEWLSTALAETLAAEMGAGGDLRTVPGEDVSRAKVELSITNPNTLGEETLKRLGANVRADLVLSGSYLTLGDKGGGKLRLDLQVHDVARGEVVAKVNDSGTEAELLDLVARSGTRLREQLGLSRLSMAQAEEVASTLPGRPEATRLYAEGLARLRAWDYGGAKDLLEKAAALEPDHPLIQSAVSATWVAIGDKVKARAAAKQALALAGPLSREERLFVEGLYHEAAEEWDEAERTYQSLWTFAPDNIEYGLHLARMQLEKNQGPDMALKTVAALRALPKPLSEDPRIDILEARTAQAASDYPREREAAARAASRAEKLGARLLVAKARLHEAWALSLMGDNTGALAAYEESRRICEAAGQKECVAIALEGLGILRSDLGELDEARAKLEDALKLRRDLGAESSQLSTLTNLALVMQRQGDLRAARKANQEVLDLSRRLGTRMWSAYAMVNLGHLFQKDGELSQAEKNYEDALAIFREVHEGRGAAECLAGLGEVQLKRGELELAATRLNEGFTTLKAINVKDGMFRVLSAKGELSRYRGEGAAARKLYTEALTVANELGERGSAAEARLALVELALDDGRSSEAVPLARQVVDEFALQKQEAAESRARSALALALLAEHKLDEAKAEIIAAGTLAEKSADRQSLAAHQLAAARVLGALPGNATRAARTLEGQYPEITRLGALPLQYEARLVLGELALSGGRAGSARKDLKTLAKEARSHQFLLMARKALARAEKPPP